MVHSASILPLANLDRKSGRRGIHHDFERNTESDVGPSGRGSSRKVSVASVPNVQQPYSSRAPSRLEVRGGVALVGEVDDLAHR